MTSRQLARGFTGLVLLTLALVGPVAPAGASTTTVSVNNMAFTPSSVTVGLGGVVNWVFHETHTTTSDQGFWKSGDKNAGQSFARTFIDAGTFAYHCSIHPEMHGSVHVPLKFAGTPSRGYALRWSTRTTTPSTIKYDVRVKRIGTTSWSGWRTATASRTGTFNPAGVHSYYLRVRTHLGGAVSGWSPLVRVKIT